MGLSIEAHFSPDFFLFRHFDINIFQTKVVEMCARVRWVERGVTITEKVKKHRWGSRYKYIDHPIYYIDYPINCIDYPINFLQSEHIIKNGGVYWARCNIKRKFPKLAYLLKVRKTSDQIEINCAQLTNFSEAYI